MRRECVGKTNCLLTNDDIKRLLGGASASSCTGKPMRLRVILECVPMDVPEAYTQISKDSRNRVLGLHYEARFVPYPFKFAAKNGYHTYAMFAESTGRGMFGMAKVFSSNGGEALTGVKLQEFTGSPVHEMLLHRMGGGFQLNTRMGASGYNFWTFRVTGVKAFKRYGGFLSVFLANMGRDLCDSPKCDLRRCYSDPCEIQVHLDAVTPYMVMLHGFTKQGDALIPEIGRAHV